MAGDAKQLWGRFRVALVAAGHWLGRAGDALAWRNLKRWRPVLPAWWDSVRQRRGRAWIVLAVSLLPLLWVFLSHQHFTGAGENRAYLGEFGHLTGIEDAFVDRMFRYRGPLAAIEPESKREVRVIHVDVDSLSTSKLGNFPWDRSWFATTAAALVQTGEAKAVLLDLVMTEKGLPRLFKDRLVEGNAVLAQLLASEPRIVLAASYASATFLRPDGTLARRVLPLHLFGLPEADAIELPELPELLLPPSAERPEGGATFTPPQVGLVDSLGGDLRWVPLFSPPPTGFPPFLHLALEGVRRYWDLPRGGVAIEPDRIELREEDGRVRRVIPLTREQLVQVNWHTRWDAAENPRVSFVEVYQQALLLRSDAGEREEAAAREYFAQFRDAVVVIGPVDPQLQSLAPTPIDPTPVPRTSLLSNLVKTIAADHFIQRAPGWLEVTLIILVGWLTAGLAVWGRGAEWQFKVAAVGVVAGYTLLAFELFARFHLHLPLTAPLGAAFTTSFAASLAQLVIEQRQKGRIRELFSTYLSREVVNRMVEKGETPQLGGQQAEITAYFSDIQGFSAISEIVPPEPLVELMNEYLTACTDVIDQESGTLDKYIGDAVVAMFGAPLVVQRHAWAACRAALRVQERQGELRHKWRVEGRDWPELVLQMRTRIGLNTGSCIVGNMGSQTRFNYTMMGDDVNLAARLEGAAKQYGVFVLVADRTREQAERAGDDFAFRFLDVIEVAGRRDPVRIFELVNWKSKLKASDRECLDRFAEARQLYAERRWKEAEALFRRCQNLEPNQPGRSPGVKNNPSMVFAHRCHLLAAQPPAPDWDGVFRLTEK